MRTRTLLLLAVVCGMAILVAGVAQLLRIASESDDGGEQLHSIGDTVEVGDLEVEVTGYDESPDAATVTVRLAGVDDPDGSASFRLVLPGEALVPGGDGSGECGATTVAEQTCTLTFALDDPAGGARVLLYERGDTRARWALGD